MRHRPFLLAACAAVTVVALTGCAANDNSLRISAAASLRGALEQIVPLFEQEHPDIDIAPIVYDGSSVLATQVSEGAPVDVVAFADDATMDRIAEFTHDTVIIASNSLVIALADPSVPVTTLEDLARPDLDVVLCAEAVPCGAAAQSALAAADITVTPASREQNVTAVATKVASGDADAGLVYRTEAATRGLITIEDDRLDAIINNYPVAIVSDSSHPAAASAFIDFLLTDVAQAELAQLGFQTP
ncbi:molybdate ABC transporter substrate-binding protein [Microbacterium amylolyticum]|uniref:Molybdate transport system substrate-binding protein n=1 Tax=Microbacterium amylolyticum TaxID=936337 RepID=A0ABS4ZEZ4_9MICO|nr:molybdate ABC transporter substrate-binding protein [Microbacterium amylolyticum]MBP2435782.1 molybdate transport system substrate-binding protein [Microbacterium amylolyticum]